MLVSVIIPTFNRVSLLVRAINSVLVQTYQNFELIIIDDASAQDVEKVIKGFNDPRIRYIRHNCSKGSSAARNTGIKNAKGEYLSFLDDDDEFLPEKLEKQVNKFFTSSDNIGIVYSGFYHVDKNGDVVKTEPSTAKGHLYTQLLKSNICGAVTVMVRKECFDKCGLFDETMPSCEDWDMWLRIAVSFDFDYVDEILARYYIHGGQKSTDLNRRIKAREMFIKKHFDSLRNDPSVFSYHMRWLSKLYYLNNNFDTGYRCILASLSLTPFYIKSYKHLLFATFMPENYKEFLEKRERKIRGVVIYT